ncbi:hypothetical protein [Pelagibacterium montanilacus]|uniref:hypothetical protein n=1 Tax=Pelagibacterium montanilacus TaxID=2185280 RepID=UPI000F8E69AB|nr:hypothetical protein [Pelagibacterium montanilacus]
MSAAFWGACLLALIHLAAGRVNIAEAGRASWRSFAGGVATAYVFIHILPVITRFATLAGEDADRWQRGEWVFATALAGTCIYYAIEKAIPMHGPAPKRGDGPTAWARPWANFGVHILAFGFYNFLIGYLLSDHPARNMVDAAAVYGALGLHMLVVDKDLRLRHEKPYDRIGRWVMAAAVVAGAAAGQVRLVPETAMIAGFALLAGGMMLNVLKEELPARGKGRLIPFLAGAGLFGTLFIIA